MARWSFLRRLPICKAPSQPGGTWLELREVCGEMVAGCRVCEAAVKHSPWAAFQVKDLRQRAVQKHGQSRLHRLAFAGTDDVPSPSEYEEVLKDLKGKGRYEATFSKILLERGAAPASVGHAVA